MDINKYQDKAKYEYSELKRVVSDKDWRSVPSEQRKNVVFLISSFVLLIIIIAVGCGSSHYLGGKSGTVKAYSATEDGVLEYCADLPRGTAVKQKGSASKMTVVEDGVESEMNVAEIETPEIMIEDNKETEIEAVFVPADNVVNSKKDIVQETELFVRTPVTVYENSEGPEIISSLGKGTHLDIIEAGNLLESGYVDKYKVAFTDVNGNKGEGYVFGKYLVGTEEEALENYNLHGEYDTAAKAEYGFDLGGGHAKNLDYYPVEKPEIEGNEFCTNARTMYLNCWAGVNSTEYIKLINETDCNAVVIDIKDGQLAYKSEVAKELCPSAYKTAYASEEEYKKGVQSYKDAGVYTIGRIVVFNDGYYAKDHPEDCIASGSSTYWPSGFSRNVWEYNVKLAQEAVEKFGFNEIQFDYVRFPESSFDMSKNPNTDFRNVYGEEKAQAIQGFCYYACDQLHEKGAYVSVDVFGECSNEYVTAYGQYWPAISNVVDAVSSMPYSDHHGNKDTWTNPYGTLNAWAKRTVKRQGEIPTPAVDRTWITGYNTPYWRPTVNYDTAKMKEQIKALTDAGLNGGFIPWNAASDITKYRQYKDIWNKSAE